MQLKRLWDTEGKKIVFTEWPTGHQCQVWTDDEGNLYIYDMAQWLTYNGVSPDWKEYVRSNWVVLTDQTVWFYDTNEPTELFSWDSWDKASYKFVDWDWTVLKSWTVEEWETPTAPADPTREATAQYTYTFAWWNPEVWPITKKTTYTATYTAVANTYTVTIESNDTDYGTVSPSTVTEVPYWTAISSSSNTLTIWETTVTATAETGYEFVSWTCSWSTIPATVTEDITIVATYRQNLSNQAYLAEDGSVDNPLIVLFTDGSDHENNVEILITTDPDTWDTSVEITPEWIYADSRLEIDWTNVFVSLFENHADYTYYTELAWSWTTGDTWTILSEFFTALKNLFNNPTAENLATAGTILSWYSVADPRTMFVTWTTPTPPTPVIPDTYQEVQYIQNTGDEYISTGMGATTGSTEVEIDFEVLTHTSNTETFIYWVWDSDEWFRAWPIDDSWTTSFWFTYDPSTYATNTRTTATGTSETTTSNYAYIFWQGEWASVTHYNTGTMKLYSLVIKENNVVVRNFIPCYIKATNEAWLYDTVTETFYGNASGNGALVAWPDAN